MKNQVQAIRKVYIMSEWEMWDTIDAELAKIGLEIHPNLQDARVYSVNVPAAKWPEFAVVANKLNRVTFYNDHPDQGNLIDIRIECLMLQLDSDEEMELASVVDISGGFKSIYTGCSNTATVYVKNGQIRGWHYGYPCEFTGVDQYTIRSAEASCYQLLVGRKLTRQELVARRIWK